MMSLLRSAFSAMKAAVLKRVKWRDYQRRKIHIGGHCVINNVVYAERCKIEPYCRFVGVPKITIGSDFYANCFCHFLGEITIGNNVMIGPKVIIWARDHKYDNRIIPMNKQGHNAQKIVIEDDVWIGAGVIILKGVTVGRGSVIGAGSVVTKNVEAYAIVAGNPARKINERR